MRNKNINDGERVSAKEKALNLLLYKTRTEKELYDKLVEKGYSGEEAEEALDYVRSYGYVNDEDYAKRYVSANCSLKGAAALKMELKRKGIPQEYIDDALLELPDDSNVIGELLKKKAGEPHKLEEKEYRRLFGFLARRGFSAGSIGRALKEYSVQDM